MKQTWKIAAVAAGMLVLAGCGGQSNQQQAPSSQAPTAQAPAESTNQPATNNGIISSIKDAMGLGKVMKCTYQMANNNEQTEVATYVNGKQFLTTQTVAGKTNHALSDGTTMYTWTEGQNQGMKIDLTCAQDLAKSVPQGQAAPDPTGEKSFDQAANVSCEPASDVDFSVPQGVNFADQCAMLKNVMKNIPSAANMPKIPANIPQTP